MQKSFRNSVLVAISPVQGFVLEKGVDLYESSKARKEPASIRDEIAILREENRNLHIVLAENKRLRDENRALKKALQIELLEGGDFVFAKTIGRDLYNQKLIISHNKGVEEGDLVVSPEGVLVGKIGETNKNFSFVVLITSKDSAIEVKVQNEDNPIGVLQGTGEGVEVDLLPRDKKVEKGDSVIALAGNNLDNKVIYVGRILQKKDRDIDTFIKADIWQNIDPLTITNLFILKRDAY